MAGDQIISRLSKDGLMNIQKNMFCFNGGKRTPAAQWSGRGPFLKEGGYSPRFFKDNQIVSLQVRVPVHPLVLPSAPAWVFLWELLSAQQA